ncbi:coiled-coil domain-containing protein 93 homolog [Carica papaya]|uniref:coiled-coil domain-containing protein 93 homolog n=1 Tax=Carica papaya TaxID=3649 RepID=UPI000B8C81AD|nr:coiled-coil domain-containing protein 93 homolog [Carica papaya]
MADSESDSQLQLMLRLLESAGFLTPDSVLTSTADNLIAGISRCIAALSTVASPLDAASIQVLNKTEAANQIEEALRFIGCPYQLQAIQILDLDYEGVIPVVEWLINSIQKMKEDSKYKVEHPIEDRQRTLQQIEEELNSSKTSIKMLSAELTKQNKKKNNIMNELRSLQERINNDGADTSVQKLRYLLQLLKALEKRNLEFQSNNSAKHFALEADISDLEERVGTGCDANSLADGLNGSLKELLEQLNSAKKLWNVMVISQVCSIWLYLEFWYERRFSELNANIQEKFQQTRKYYATYNALLEIKELMLKENLLLNSLSSQFQEAFSTPAGRMKLMHSMEGIIKGSQQKLEKVQLGLQEEQKVCDALKERYSAAISEQRRCYSFLKAFQEECARNERLRGQGDSDERSK